MTIDEMISVLLAAKAGKRVEFIEVGNGSFWCEFSDTKDFSAWNFSKYKYRVKPEPREWLMQESVLDSCQVKPEWITELDKFIKVIEVLP